MQESLDRLRDTFSFTLDNGDQPMINSNPLKDEAQYYISSDDLRIIRNAMKRITYCMNQHYRFWASSASNYDSLNDSQRSYS